MRADGPLARFNTGSNLFKYGSRRIAQLGPARQNLAVSHIAWRFPASVRYTAPAAPPPAASPAAPAAPGGLIANRLCVLSMRESTSPSSSRAWAGRSLGRIPLQLHWIQFARGVGVVTLWGCGGL
jgi:hypothetical protein